MKSNFAHLILVVVIWGFPAMGVPLNHPFIDGIFPINHLFFGYPHLRNPPSFTACELREVASVKKKKTDAFLAVLGVTWSFSSHAANGVKLGYNTQF